MADNTGLGLGYRMAWRMEYLGVTFFGPPQQMPEHDPKRRLRLQRAERVRDAHLARGTQPSQETLDIIEFKGAPPKEWPRR